MTDRPHATVATVVQKDGLFLLVKEFKNGREVYNQPAGHVENGESLPQAALRETLEETRWHIQLDGVIGVSVYHAANGVSYVRTTFHATPINEHRELALDSGIIEAVWLSYDQIKSLQAQLRSPMVLQVIEDYLGGTSYPLALVSEQR